MVRYFFLTAIIALLWPMSLSTHECNRTITNGQISFLCPSNVSNQALRLYDLPVAVLDSISSIVAQGYNATSLGPFTSIPPNICLLRNLQVINFASNQITVVDPTGSVAGCLSNVVTLNLQSNNISQFPSFMIYNMPNLKNLNFQGNQLTDIPANAFVNVSLLETINFSYNQLTTFELWALEVKTSADFSSNQISAITNKYLFTQFLNTGNTPTISLTNNRPTINFTDAVYEMYNQCDEVYQWYYGNFSTNIPPPLFTPKLAQIDFGTMQIKCSCDQLYFLSVLKDDDYTFHRPDLPIRTATCVNDSMNINNITFLNSSCASHTFDVNITVNFSTAYPRLCKVLDNEQGGLTTIANISAPVSNAPSYPYYKTAFLNPGACVFAFSNQTTMSIECTNDTSNSQSTIPNDLLSSSYMAAIKSVTFPSLISSLPSYLCSLPSREIDLNHQAFTTLTDATFPCLDSFTKVTLSYNQLTSVNMASGNFKNLTSLDLSSNQLSTLPYSILRPTPTSLRYLDLRNNSITSIDLFLYTLINITVNLDNNPINGSVIVNPQNATLANNTVPTINITFPATVANSTKILQDTTVATLVSCASFDTIRSFLQNFRLTAANVLLRCTCASFSLRQLYQTNGFSITDDFSCSSPIEGQTFQNLTNTTCSNAVSFQTGPCGTQSPSPIPSVQSSGGSGNSNSNRTGLIVGLVVGIVGFFLLVGALVAAYYIFKSKSALGVKKPVSRATVISQTPGDTLSTRVQPRNLRSVRLAPIPTSATSALPNVPVKTVAATNSSSFLYNPSTAVPTSAKGIPVQLDSIRSPSEVSPKYPPNSNALNNSSSFRPINNNLSAYQVQLPQQQPQAPKPQKPRATQMLNTGGDTRY